jgi:hypothetical protein
MEKLIPKAILEEFERNLKSANGSQSKMNSARRLVGSRLVVKKWYELVVSE